MFVDFFYKLKEVGVPVSPTAFLTLQKALSRGLVTSVDDFYTSSRAILVKSERYFDLFDQVFAFHFEGVELPDTEGMEFDDLARAMHPCPGRAAASRTPSSPTGSARPRAWAQARARQLARASAR